MVMHSDMEKLRQTGETISRDEFNAAVQAILKAKRVYVLGVRSAAPLADFLGYYLNYMFQNVHVVTNSGTSEMFEKIVGISSEDVAIAFSFPRYSAATSKGAQYCRSTGATVIGLTDTRLSPLGQNADHVLVAKSDMVSLVDSLVAPLSVTNALIVAVAAKREKELGKTFNALEHIWEEYNVYEKRVEHL
jgi:DNA-binding MurR/RpiR family transcriptional regulator